MSKRKPDFPMDCAICNAYSEKVKFWKDLQPELKSKSKYRQFQYRWSKHRNEANH